MDNATGHEDVTSYSDKEKLELAFRLTQRVAAGRGWQCKEIARDLTNHRYGTLAVSRWVPNAFRAVTATLEVTVSPKLTISYHLTSPYNDGFDDFWETLRRDLRELPWVKDIVVVNAVPSDSQTDPPTASAEQLLIRLLRRFHSVVKQLRHRRENRPTLLVTDEYDIQDLLHSLLRGLFDDVRSEEYSPSYAGGASRMDFLLKAQKTVVEVKMVSTSLRDRQIGDELLIDIGRYRAHTDCRTLFCFVYDPGGFLRNPVGIEADLTGDQHGLRVVTVVLSL